ncbi:MAG TPA: Uma2 family endonuclease [Nitrospirae bacterium]|nr:Uma2 family endonuclease [Nitrospirota bacterium]
MIISTACYIGKVFISPIDVLLDSHTVVQPDIIFISKNNLSIITEKNIQGNPNLTIEILSPGTIQKDRIVKMKTYAKHGIKHLWLIDPENQTLESFELDRKKTCRLVSGIAGEEEFKPSLFPNLTIPLKKLWG